MTDHWIDQEPGDKAPPIPFDPLKMAQRHWSDNERVRYRVYRSAGDFEEVEAPTASLALMKANIATPYKIERFLLDHQPMVDDTQLTDAVDVYERPILDRLTEDSPVVSNEILTGLVDAAQEIAAEQIPSAAEPAAPPPLAETAEEAAEDTRTAAPPAEAPGA